MKIAIIGSGLAGILSAIKFKEAGYDVVVYEKANDLGGTWRDNTYPGVGCDVPSHLYCYSFSLNPEWSRFMAPGSEILQYLKDVTKKYQVESLIKYGHEVEACKFRGSRWNISFKHGGKDEADVLIAATGVLHHPQYPNIKGLNSFAGACFHTAKWDHSEDLKGKRVGIIGSGSTSVQVACALVESVEHFTMFQRTPQWVFPLENRTYSEDQKSEFRGDSSVLETLYHQLSMKCTRNFANAVVDSKSKEVQQLAEASLEHLESSVNDPVLKEKLRPNYQAACKRLVISNDFYKAIQHPNASLVTEGIESIVSEGVRTNDGVLHELDVLVLATGFQVTSFTRPMKVIGRNGVDLDKVWERRPGAYLSVSVPEFPNLFMVNGPNGPVGNISLMQVAEMEVAYIMQLVQKLRSTEVQEISVSQMAFDAFDVERIEQAKKTIWATGCKSWYLDDRGVPLAWPWRFERFRQEMSEPNMEDYDCRSD